MRAARCEGGSECVRVEVNGVQYKRGKKRGCLVANEERMNECLELEF